MSANDRQHKPRFARMIRGVCKSVGWHRYRAMTCTMSKDLCVSGKWRRLRECGLIIHIGHGLYVSFVACAHHFVDVCSRLLVSSVICTHHSVFFGCEMLEWYSIFTKWYVDSSPCMLTSPFVYTQCFVNVTCSLPWSFLG